MGHFTARTLACMAQTLPARSCRKKRSSILSYLLGDGSNVDFIQNHVHDLASIMNQNIEAAAKNEESLQFAERLNAQSITSLENAIEYTGLTEISIYWHTSDQIKAEQQNQLRLANNLILLEDLSECHSQLLSFSNLLGPVLLHKQEEICTHVGGKYGCIMVGKSLVRIEPTTGTCCLELAVKSLKKEDIYFLTCLPDLQNMMIIFTTSMQSWKWMEKI
jgi:hypothetical protein